MAQQDDMKRAASGSPWATMVILAVLISGGLYYVASPLISQRPERSYQMSEVVRGTQKLELRLWQDPFEAMAGLPEESNRIVDLSQFADKVDEYLSQASSGQVLILPVIATGGTYSEDTESRLRQRRAVVAALASSGYLPANAERIGVMRWRPQTGPVGAGTKDEFRIPFEWFHARQKPADAPADVAVLWISSSQLLGRPLLQLSRLVAEIRRGGPESGNDSEAPRPQFKVIGPRTSDGLQDMLLELDPDHYAELGDSGVRAATNQWVMELFSEVPIYSPWATAPDRQFEFGTEEGSIEESQLPRRKVINAFSRQGLRFNNYITTDDLLCELMLDELSHRGVDLSNNRDGIVFISEYDTQYGRTFPRTFASKLLPARSPGVAVPEDPSGYRKFCMTNGIFMFGYLRGADGERPVGEQFLGMEEQEFSQPPQRSQAQRQAALKQERPEGPGQLDYIRRLAWDLHQLEESSSHQSGKQIRAIGVMGSDFYDKLLVIQALRPLFPDALFFTTDLDARMVHASQIRWTRNLLVATGYGLRMGLDNQVSVASFREGYQVATFRAVRDAVTGGNERPYNAAPPIIYEIGRKNAIRLPVVAQRSSTSNDVHDDRELDDLEQYDFRHAAVFAILIVLFIWYLFPSFIRNVRDQMRQMGRDQLPKEVVPKRPQTTYLENPHQLRRWDRRFFQWRRLAGAAALTFIVVLAPAYVAFSVWQSSQPNGEPWFIASGVSVWPTEFLRLLVFYLCVAFLFLARSSLRRNKIELNREFCLAGRVHLISRLLKWRRIHRRLQARRWDAKTGRILKPDLSAPWWKRIWNYRMSISKMSLGRWLEEDGEPNGSNLRTRGRNRLPLWLGEPLHRLWLDYNAMGFTLNRVFRISTAILLYLVIGSVLMRWFGQPSVPFRGDHILIADKLPLVLSVIGQLFITFFVLDAALLCRRLILKLTHPDISWPRATLQKFAKRFQLPVDRASEMLREWLDIQLIARRTDVIMPLIYYPFFTLTLMVLARSNLFDRWNWPVGLVLIIGFVCFLAFTAVWVIRRSAEKARSICLGRMEEQLLRFMGTDDRRLMDQYRELRREVQQCQVGAFAPMSEQPILRVLLLPFGGASLYAVLELMAFL